MKLIFKLTVLLLLVALFLLNLLASHEVGTCTMGDDGRFFGGLFPGIPLLILSLAVTSDPQLRQASAMGVRLPLYLMMLASLAMAWLWVPDFLSATMAGHHLCGAEYDFIKLEDYGLMRWMPLINILQCIAVAAMLWRVAASPG